jgi:hypothetical protein
LWSCAAPSVVTGSAPSAPQALGLLANSTGSGFSHKPSGDLMYVSDSIAGQVLVYTYPQGDLVTTLSGMAHPRGECVDSAGNVYIANSNKRNLGSIHVFAHGASSPSNVLNFPDAIAPDTCSVDAKSGDLAVVNSTDQVEIYDPARQAWSDDIDVYAQLSAVAYDDRGDLFVGGPGGRYGYFQLAVIPKSEKCFCSLSLNQNIGSRDQNDYSLQWDGSYLTLTNLAGGEHHIVYRISVSGKKAEVVGTIDLRKKRHDVFASGYSWIHGNRILAPDNGGAAVASWRYPDGGRPAKHFGAAYHHVLGIAISDGTNSPRTTAPAAQR